MPSAFEQYKPSGLQAVGSDKISYDRLKLKYKKKIARLNRNRGVSRRNVHMEVEPSENGTEYFTRV